MSSFTSRLEVSPMPDGRHWKLTRSFSYDAGFKGSWQTITVPAGFITDFASSPFVVWSFIPKWGKYGKAAIIHDYLYQKHRFNRRYTRKYADGIFLEAMVVLDVARWRRKLMYWGVRAFGWLAWR